MQYPKLDYKKGALKKDACYHKVKSRYSVWPSAYASGALAKCRKVGASNWGSKKQMGGVDVDFRTADERKADSKAQKKQDRKDKKGMIPARFRNRGQEGLDAYKKMMIKKRKRKKIILLLNSKEHVQLEKQLGKEIAIEKLLQGLGVKVKAVELTKDMVG